MPRTTRPATIRTRDTHNRPIVRVPLDPHGNQWATLDEADFDNLPSNLSPHWTVNHNGRRSRYVRVRARGRNANQISVARIIVDAGPGTRVAYWNGDPLDLRRVNLEVEQGGKARCEDRSLQRPPVLSKAGERGRK